MLARPDGAADPLDGLGGRMGQGEEIAGFPAASTSRGSFRGGTGDFSGTPTSSGTITSLTVGRDVVGGDASGTADLDHSGCIPTGRAGVLAIRGSLVAGTRATLGLFKDNGVIRVTRDLGTATIRSVLGNPGRSRGRSVPVLWARPSVLAKELAGCRLALSLLRAMNDSNDSHDDPPPPNMAGPAGGGTRSAADTGSGGCRAAPGLGHHLPRVLVDHRPRVGRRHHPDRQPVHIQ
jgi:hypothetical protein